MFQLWLLVKKKSESRADFPWQMYASIPKKKIKINFKFTQNVNEIFIVHPKKAKVF